MRIAIIGSGGVGGYLGAKLWKAGNEVGFVAHGDHLTAMQQRGLQLESPDDSFTVKSTFTENVSGFAPFDLIIISVKSFDTESAAKHALPVIKDDTIVLSIQNGVENEDILVEIFGGRHVLGGVAYIFSTIAEAGIIRHEGGVGKFKFGEMDGSVSERCRRLMGVFIEAGIMGEAIENIKRTLWEKWIFICGLSGMTTYTRKSIGEILTDNPLKSMLQDVVHEVAKIGRIKGIDDFTAMEEKAMLHYERLPYPSTSSMYYDLTHGKRIELDALNGAVVRFGKGLNIQIPANELIFNSLKQYTH